MWEYTDKVMDYFNHPRNCGVIKDADGVAQVGNLVCGDSMKLFLKMASDKKTIADAKFQTFGCASAIASASALTVMIIGKTLDYAVQLTNSDIVSFLGGLPEEKEHCSVMGVEALQAALVDMAKRHPEIDVPVAPVAESRVICKCFNVTEDKIRKVVKQNHLTTVDQVTNYTKAGGACGHCKQDIQKLLDEINGTTGQDTATGRPVAKLTNLQKIALIKSVFENEIIPGLKADGGSAELVDVDGDKVYARLTGRCASCPSAKLTLKHWVEAKLREKVSPAISVQEAR